MDHDCVSRDATASNFRARSRDIFAPQTLPRGGQTWAKVMKHSPKRSMSDRQFQDTPQNCVKKFCSMQFLSQRPAKTLPRAEFLLPLRLTPEGRLLGCQCKHGKAETLVKLRTDGKKSSCGTDATGLQS